MIWWWIILAVSLVLELITLTNDDHPAFARVLGVMITASLLVPLFIWSYRYLQSVG